MTIRIRRFEPGDLPAIERLNARLAERGITDRVGREQPMQPSEERGDPVSRELFVAVDGDEVRGGVWLHEHQFRHRSETIRAGWLKYPVAESLIDRTYAGVPGALLFALMRRQPNLMALGMGDTAAPLARLLAGMGWSLTSVPFHLTPVRAARLFRYLPHLRRSRVMAAASGIAARTGAAAAVCAPLSIVRRVGSSVAAHGVSTHVVAEFGDWTDALWLRCREHYGFIARRDAAMLNQFYPANFRSLTRLRLKRRGEDIGWMCVTLSDAGRAADFGGLRVGLLVDGFGNPDDARAILAAGMQFLAAQGADLIVTNQLHRSWREPLRHLGFIQRPSNFVFAVSKPLTALLAAETAGQDIFLNRGDCDGPPRW